MYLGAFDWTKLWQDVATWVSTSGVKLILGLIGLFILFKLVNMLAKGIRKSMMKKNVETTICKVTYGIIRKGLKIVIFLIFLGFVGIETAGIGSIVASIGIAVGLALQGSLSNMAGGIIILIMRPFRIGDYIAAQSNEGTVEDIHMFYTTLVTVDNKVVSLPNGALSNGSIINFSQKELRRVDMTFNISYDANLALAEEMIFDAIESIPFTLTVASGAPANPFVKLTKQGESALEMTAKVWVKASDYWEVYFRMQKGVFENFKTSGISVPYPQLDVHYAEAPAPKEAVSALVKGTETELAQKRKEREERYANEEETARVERKKREKEELRSMTDNLKKTFAHQKSKKSKKKEMLEEVKKEKKPDEVRKDNAADTEDIERTE